MRDYAYIDGEHSPIAQKLTTGHWVMLRDAEKYGDACYSKRGRSEIGAAGQTLRKLRGLGLLDADNKITELGKRMRKVEWRKERPMYARRSRSISSRPTPPAS